MSDYGWDDYNADDSATATVDDGTVADLSAASSDLDSAAVADDWSDWNAATGDEYAESASNDLDAAQTYAEEGWTDSAQYELNVASNEADVAGNAYDTASDYSDTADSYVADASANIEDASYGSDVDDSSY